MRRLLTVVMILALACSCASVGRIEGGPIDETPPLFLESTPAPGALNVDRKRISIAFDEFIVLKDPAEKVVISPPQVQQPEIKTRGKRVVVNLEDTLKPNTTYTIDFADAIQDNNENNPLEQFTFTFSTGAQLDTMAVAGTVLNAENLEPIKGIMVGLYSNLSDTAFTTQPFDRVGRTDSRGNFSIRGVAPGTYRIYALQDADQNYFYSQPVEQIAWDDSLVIPRQEQRTRMDTTWIDSLTIDTIVEREYTYYLPDNILLRAFKKPTVSGQRLAKTERLTARKFSFYFTAPNDTLPTLRGLNFDEREAFVLDQTTGRNDTLHYWIKDSSIYKLDTLKMELAYLYTDTLNQLVPKLDTLNLVARETYAKYLEDKQKRDEEKLKELQKEARRKRRRSNNDSIPQAEPTLPTEFLDINIYAPASLDAYDYLTFTFTEPVQPIDTACIHLNLKVDSLWQPIPYDLVRDSLDPKIYNLYADWDFGLTYKLDIDSAGITGLYGLHTDKQSKEMTIKKVEDYGQIFFDITGAAPGSFVELLDGSDQVIRTIPVTNNRADFYYLTPGKYGARLVEDRNGNGRWDIGSYEQKLQPEPVYYYFQVLELKANFDLTQTWNLHERALNEQKPLELKKQKPDEKKKRNNRSSSQSY